MQNLEYVSLFQNVLLIESNALQHTAQKVANIHSQDLFKHAINGVIKLFEHLHSMPQAKVISCGVGKSAIIAQKYASTLSSLGLPSFFLHPNEALHGDLGKLNAQDVLCFFSNSGNTKEILEIIPFLPMPKSQRIGIFGKLNGSLSQEVEYIFDASVEKEACINNLAPTCSTTVALGISDALCVLYEKWVGLTKDTFSKWHPGGILGKSLLLKVKDLMIDRHNCAILSKYNTFQDLIMEMTKKPLGICVILDNSNQDKEKFLGIIVEGDIRRALTHFKMDFSTPIEKMINTSPVTCQTSLLAIDALQLMEQGIRPINVMPVLEEEKFVGIIRPFEFKKDFGK